MLMAMAELRHQRRPLAATLAAASLESPRRRKLPMDGLAPFPVLEVDRPQPVPQPFVQLAEHARGLSQTGILLPPARRCLRPFAWG